MKHRKYIIEKSMCTLHKMSPNIIFLTHFVALLCLSLVLQTLVEILIILNAIKYLLGSPKYLWQNYWHTKIIIKSTDIKLNKPSSRFLFPFPFPFPASLSWSLSFSCFFFSSSFLACASRYPSGYYVNLQSSTSFLKQRDHLKVERTGQRFCTNFGSRIIYHSGQIK